MKMLFMNYGWAHSIRDTVRRKWCDRVSFETATGTVLIAIDVNI